ncbi:MAG: hypothetical protein CMM07_10430 [Rhodopirellula sp.]|nr:hypothetical protein [Rhodopirellula sp.]
MEKGTEDREFNHGKEPSRRFGPTRGPVLLLRLDHIGLFRKTLFGNKASGVSQVQANGGMIPRYNSGQIQLRAFEESRLGCCVRLVELVGACNVPGQLSLHGAL